MKPLHVAIPSYHRPEMCRDKTLRLLTERGVDPTDITVFVADDEELRAYRAALPDVALVVSAPGLGPSRNFIAEYYPADSWVLNCDDDLDDLLELVGDDLEPVMDVPALAAEAFSTCERLGVRLWGVYPVPNPFFMRRTTTSDLRLVAGPFYGTIATPDDPDTTHITVCPGGEKEDHERTLRYFCADGGVLRLGRVAVKTRWYKNAGGLQGTRTATTEEEAVDALVAGWPGLVRRNPRRRSGFPEVRLVSPKAT